MDREWIKREINWKILNMKNLYCKFFARLITHTQGKTDTDTDSHTLSINKQTNERLTPVYIFKHVPITNSIGNELIRLSY